MNEQYSTDFMQAMDKIVEDIDKIEQPLLQEKYENSKNGAVGYAVGQKYEEEE